MGVCGETEPLLLMGMELKTIILSEIDKIWKDKYCMFPSLEALRFAYILYACDLRVEGDCMGKRKGVVDGVRRGQEAVAMLIVDTVFEGKCLPELIIVYNEYTVIREECDNSYPHSLYSRAFWKGK